MKSVDLEQLLLTAREQRASDVLLTAGSPPIMRIDGVIRVGDAEPLDGATTCALVYDLLTKEQADRLESLRELDFSLSRDGHRFRGNAYWQAGTVAAAFRLIPDEVPTPEQLGLPPIMLECVTRPQGLVLVTGASDQGKTTTQAALVGYLNRTAPKHIITIEDPVEFVHKRQQSVIDQRELGSDTLSFAEALRHALRQTPDVLLVGEMRDRETVQAALVAAETGHLVLSTLHTNDACQALDRIIQLFPESDQAPIRAQLSLSLLVVLAQRLARARDGRLVLAAEVLRNTHAVANLIREGKIYQIYTTMETSQRQGMQTMNQALQELVQRGTITETEARRYVNVHESALARSPALAEP